MLKRLTRRLMRSAAGRNLAIDLVEAHGERALDIVDAAIASGDPDDARMLAVARREILKLLPLLRASSDRWAGSCATAPGRRSG